MCWCPCGCGCVDDSEAPCGPLLPNGLCADCDEGEHEMPPPGTSPAAEDLILKHMEIALYMMNKLKVGLRT